MRSKIIRVGDHFPSKFSDVLDLEYLRLRSRNAYFAMLHSNLSKLLLLIFSFSFYSTLTSVLPSSFYFRTTPYFFLTSSLFLMVTLCSFLFKIFFSFRTSLGLSLIKPMTSPSKLGTMMWGSDTPLDRKGQLPLSARNGNPYIIYELSCFLLVD